MTLLPQLSTEKTYQYHTELGITKLAGMSGSVSCPEGIKSRFAYLCSPNIHSVLAGEKAQTHGALSFVGGSSSQCSKKPFPFRFRSGQAEAARRTNPALQRAFQESLEAPFELCVASTGVP